MAVSDELLVSVKIDTSSGTVAVKDLSVSFNDLKKSSDSASKSVDDSNVSFKGMAASAIVLNQALELGTKLWRGLVGPIEKATDAFIEQEKVDTTLRNTLKAVGITADAAFDDLSHFASSLQKTTTVGDEATMQMAILSKTIGLSNTQTKQIIKTAADMAAVLGTDVGDAMNQLLGQFQGVAGRGISKMVSGLKDLTEAELKAGKGIELVAKQFGGFAELQAKTLAGSIIQAKNALGDMWEEIGRIIVQFVNLPALVIASKEAFIQIGEAVKSFGDRLMILKDGLQKISFEELAISVASLAAAFGALHLALNAQAISSGLLAIGKALIAISIPAAIAAAKFIAISIAVAAVVIAIETLVVNFDRIPQIIETIKISFENMIVRLFRGITALGIGFLSMIESVLEPMASVSDVAAKGLEKVRAGMISLGNVTERADQAVEELNKEVAQTADGLKMGPTLSVMLKGVDAIKAAMADVNEETKATGESFKDVSKLAESLLKPTQEQLKLIEQINAENAGIATEISNMGASQIDVLENQYGLIVKQMEARKNQLELEGKLAGPAGKQIINQLQDQLDLQRQLTNARQIKAAEEQVKGLGGAGAIAGAAGVSIVRGLESSVDYIGENLGEFGKEFSDNFSTQAALGIAVGFAEGVSTISGVISGFAGIIMSMFDPKVIQGLADSLVNLVENLPDLLMKAFDSLVTAIGKIIENLPAIITNLMNSLGSIIGKIIEQLPAFIDALADGLVAFLDKLPELTAKIFEALPGIIDKILTRLPDIIDALFLAIPKIIIQLIQAIPGVIVSILNRLPEIIESVIFGLIGAMGEIVVAFVDFFIGGGLEKIIIALLQAIPRIAMALVNGIVNGLKRAAGAIFGGIKTPAFAKELTELPKKLGKGLQELSKGVAKEASQVFKVLDLQSEAAAVDRLKGAEKVTDVITEAADIVGRSIKGLWQQLLDGLKRVWLWVYNQVIMPIINGLTAVWRWVYDTIIMPIISGLKAVWEWIYNTIVEPLINGIRSVWQWVVDLLTKTWDTIYNAAVSIIQAYIDGWMWIYDNVISPLIDGVKAAFQWVWDTIIEPITSLVKDAFQFIFDFWSNIFSGKISEAFAPALEIFTSLGTTIFDGLKSGINAAGNLFSDLGSQIWSGLSSGLSGLGKILEDALNAINPGNLLGKMFKFDGGGMGDVEKALSKITGSSIDVPFVKFARGGIVPGTAMVPDDSLVNDRVLALVSPGEAIIPRSITTDPSLKPFVDALLSGSPEKLLPPFAGLSISTKGIKVDTSGISTKSVASGVSELGQKGYDTLKAGAEWAFDTLGNLDPQKLWDRFKDKALGSLYDMMANMSFHHGGLVPAFANGGEVPALLQPGEYVMQRSAVNSLGVRSLNALNGNGGSVSTQNYEVQLTVSINAAAQSLDETFVRTKLIPSIKDEFKRASLRGEFLMSQKGLRST